jgi:hypothetical protein
LLRDDEISGKIVALDKLLITIPKNLLLETWKNVITFQMFQHLLYVIFYFFFYIYHVTRKISVIWIMFDINN